jgi:hypothetical protein
MAQSIILKRSATPGKVPNTSTLNVGEIAINTYDGKVFLNRSGSSNSIEEIVTTNATNTGSITLTQTGSFGELVVTQDTNLRRDLYVVRDIITNGNIDVSGSITGSSLLIENNGNINGNLTVLGEINARQFNIGVISSSILYTSGSNKFGDTGDDTHQFTGSVSVSGSFLVNGTEVGVAAGPNTFDFNLDPEAAGVINFTEDTTGNTQAVARTGSFDVVINNNTYLSVSASAINVTTGSITANYMHLAKYISTAGDLDFNI